MFEEIFARKKPDSGKLISYGFGKADGSYRYTSDIMSSQFTLSVSIDLSGKIDTNLIEGATGEEYILYKTNAEGVFVGEVRTAVADVLTDISEKCFVPSMFKTEQAARVVDYVKSRYGDDLEFLWGQFPDTAIWRRKDNQKWYGLIQTVKGSKIGLETSETVETLNLRALPESIEAILSNKGYCTGWHMNKKHWYGIVFDGGVPDGEVYSRIDESYQIAK